VQGDVPSPAKPPPGCHSIPAAYAMAECKVTAPPLIEVAHRPPVACCAGRSAAIPAVVDSV
jgi:peptide/nickel transport system ATP-binding protein/oligopeptide transport system ATP-binding protein